MQNIKLGNNKQIVNHTFKNIIDMRIMKYIRSLMKIAPCHPQVISIILLAKYSRYLMANCKLLLTLVLFQLIDENLLY